MKNGKLILLLVLCSLLLFMAHNRAKQAQTAPAINEPPKETKLSPNNSSLEPDSDKCRFLKREFYRIDSLKNKDLEDACGQPGSDLERLGDKMRQFNHIIGPASARHDVPEKLIAAVIQVESNWDTKTEKGLMQLEPITQKETGVDNPQNPHQNVDGGTQYLKKMCDQFGSVELGLIANNIGPTKLRKILTNKKNGKIPSDAVRYAQKVMYLYQNA